MIPGSQSRLGASGRNGVAVIAGSKTFDLARLDFVDAGVDFRRLGIKCSVSAL